MEVFNETPYPFSHSHSMFNPEHPFLTAYVKGTFDLSDGAPSRPFSEEDQEDFELEANFLDRHGNSLKKANDIVPFKPRGEWVIVGSAHAPGGTPVTSLEVSATVGTRQKRLAVFGDRKWVRDADGSVYLTDPEPFTELPIRAEYAHGGPGSKYNEHGIGFGPLGPTPGDSIAAANIMANGQGTVSWEKDEPHAGFGVLAPNLLPRRAMLGTYDNNWRLRRNPLPPEDFDPAFYNAAPPDQQIDGYLAGNEEIVLRNLHPTAAEFRTFLPGTRVRCFVHHRPQPDLPNDKEFAEIAVVLDTCFIDIPENKLSLLWRGTMSIEDFKHRHIEHVLVVEEPVGEPKPVEHYATRLAALLRDDSAEIAAREEAERQAELDAMDREGLQAIVDALKKVEGAEPLIEKVQKVRTLEEAQDLMAAEMKLLEASFPKS